MKTFTGLIVIAVLSTHLAFAGEVLRVHSHVSVSKDMVYLSDLLVAPNDNIVDFMVTRAPRVAQVKVLKHSDLAAVLGNRYPGVQLMPSTDIRVERAYQIIERDRINLKVMDYIAHQWAHALESNATLTGRFTPDEFPVPTGDVDIQIKSIRPHEANSDFTAWVDIRVNDQWYQTLALDYYLEQPINALAPYSNAVKGTEVTTDTVNIVSVNRLDLECEPVTRLPEGAKFNTAVEQGKPLCLTDLDTYYTVREGEAFMVMIEVGAVGLEVQLIAKDDAIDGEVIDAIRSEMPDQPYQVVFEGGSPRIINKEMM